MTTPLSQQMVANFLLHVVNYLGYVSRQQGETKRKTVDDYVRQEIMNYPEIRTKTPGNETKFPSTMSDSRVVWEVFLNEQSKDGMYAEVFVIRLAPTFIGKHQGLP